jgi:photosystem I subunit 11|uniref:PSI subunit V n=1 Tax=Octactis speculum TaxID=3111310 RepID=A0A514CPE8_9STRA|nr:photosystem I subunit XI [Dictyocha speculum]QDH81681.1 photosystem I subunit XI [Dictyocha speculum]|tara:strand:- start:384 stop:833 length:450 start_codon:yes stop_codon:yes gene_type:complete
MANFITPFYDDPSVGHLSTPITTSSATEAILSNLPAYRRGLTPSLRGLEIGMAHGYFLLGPFYKLGPLRNSDIALLAGSMSAVGLVTILVLALVIYGNVSFEAANTQYTNDVTDKSSFLSYRGWKEFTGGFTIGGYGSVFFAALLIYVF